VGLETRHFQISGKKGKNNVASYHWQIPALSAAAEDGALLYDLVPEIFDVHAILGCVLRSISLLLLYIFLFYGLRF
jgi:hypothetical protein